MNILENAATVADLLNRFRVVPRLLMFFYMSMVYNSTQWFMNLADPTAAQAAFVGTIVGAGAAWFGLYVSSGKTS